MITIDKKKISRRRLSMYLSIFVAMPIVTYLVGSWADTVLDLPRLPDFPWNLILGFTVFLSGLSLGISATRVLYREGSGLPWGEVRSDDAPHNLVTSGPFKYTRNPMVIGYSALPFGMGIMFQSPGMMLIPTSLVLGFNILLVKLIEEKKLAKRFGHTYLLYQSNTPFLLPKTIELASFMTNWRGGYIKAVAIPILATVAVTGLISGIPNEPNLQPHSELSISIFIVILIVGGVAGMYPRQMKALLRRKERLVGEGEDPSFYGHHPNCGEFKTHVIGRGHNLLCAGCTGLTVGAMFALIVSLLTHFFGLFNYEHPVFGFGLILILCGILQHAIDLKRPLLHLMLNIGLVLGFALLRASSLLLNGGVFIDAYILCLSIYLIISRIELSKLEHRQICGLCANKGCFQRRI